MVTVSLFSHAVKTLNWVTSERIAAACVIRSEICVNRFVSRLWRGLHGDLRPSFQNSIQILLTCSFSKLSERATNASLLCIMAILDAIAS